MSTKQKSATYTVEFKESAVKLAVESNKPISETAKELGVNISTLHTWIGKYHRNSTNIEKKDNVVSQEHLFDELKRLKKENVQLKEEQAILKKAAAYFAKEIL
jgi:transposase